MASFRRLHSRLIVWLAPFLPGCTSDPGIVGSVQAPNDARDTSSTQDAGEEPPDAGDCSYYSMCVLEHLETLTYDVCVPDAVTCGTLTPEEGAQIICTTRFTRCLRDASIAECMLQQDRCFEDPWSDDAGRSAP
jgi:hypothetical protein